MCAGSHTEKITPAYIGINILFTSINWNHITPFSTAARARVSGQTVQSGSVSFLFQGCLRSGNLTQPWNRRASHMAECYFDRKNKGLVYGCLFFLYRMYVIFDIEPNAPFMAVCYFWYRIQCSHSWLNVIYIDYNSLFIAVFQSTGERWTNRLLFSKPSGIQDAALVLIKEKAGKFVPLRVSISTNFKMISYIFSSLKPITVDHIKVPWGNVLFTRYCTGWESYFKSCCFVVTNVHCLGAQCFLTDGFLYIRINSIFVQLWKTLWSNKLAF